MIPEVSRAKHTKMIFGSYLLTYASTILLAAIGFLQVLRRSVQTTFHDTVTDTEVVPFSRPKGLELSIE